MQNAMEAVGLAESTDARASPVILRRSLVATAPHGLWPCSWPWPIWVSQRAQPSP